MQGGLKKRPAVQYRTGEISAFDDEDSVCFRMVIKMGQSSLVLSTWLLFSISVQFHWGFELHFDEREWELLVSSSILPFKISLLCQLASINGLPALSNLRGWMLSKTFEMPERVSVCGKNGNNWSRSETKFQSIFPVRTNCWRSWKEITFLLFL